MATYDRYPCKPVTTNVRQCARCGGEHTHVFFHPFYRPVELEDGEPPFTHWAPCKTNGQPILLRAFDGDDEEP